MALDGKDLAGKFREESGLVSRPCADFQDSIFRFDLRRLEHGGNHVRLGGSLLLGNGNRAVGIRLAPILLAHEFMPRDLAHGREQAFIAYATLPQLPLHHGAAFSRERLRSISVHISLLSPAYVNVETQHPILVPHSDDG